jgi:hypothetical protein
MSGGAVAFDDHPLLTDGDIACRGKVVEFLKAAFGNLQFLLEASQFLVLYFQLNLVRPEVRYKLANCLGIEQV